MRRAAWEWAGSDAGMRVLLVLAALASILASFAMGAEKEDRLPDVGEARMLYRSPIAGGYEAVPLEHTDVAIDVRGLVAAATVTQRYVNKTGEPLEAVYVFPLPHDGAVYDMELRIGERRIRSVIRERAEAKRSYQQAKSEGKRAALVEEERPNVFTASVANVMPGDQVDVRIRYVEPLHWEDGRVRLVFPMVVGPRYIPGSRALGHTGSGWAMDTDAVPDGSRITPPVRRPDSRPGHDIALHVKLDAGTELAGVTSPSHDVRVARQDDGTLAVDLATAATLPNRDFVLEFQRAEAKQAETALFLSPQPEGGETHFLLVAFPPSAPPVEQRMPLEMLYLIDISGSMGGMSIAQARAALLQGLDRLRPGDRFDIVAFDDRFDTFRPEPVPASAENLEAARRFVRRLEARGGTEMLPALRHLMAMPRSEGCLRDILVLTDGDLGNEEQIFASLRRKLGDARLFTVAIGSAPNHFLATKMADYGRGSFTHVADNREIKEQMSLLLDRIESPVLADVAVSLEGAAALDLYPSRPPDLFLRQPLVLYGRFEGVARGTLHVTGRSGDKPYSTTIPFDPGAATFHPGITTLWARQSVDERLDGWRQAAEGEERDCLRAAIVAEAIRYSLVTRFTSLVAIEDVVVNPEGHPRATAVPTELPEGWQLDKVFGVPATGTADAFLEALGVALLALGLASSIALRVQSVGGRS